MPSEVYEESVELSIGLLEAGAPDPSRPNSSYPLPALSTTQRVESRKFRAIVLENSFLRVSILPDLGGRIHRILDKRRNLEILLAPKVLEPTEGGLRGAELAHGIQLRLDRRFDRLNSMGSVDILLEPEDEVRPAGVWFGELEAGTGISLNCRFALPSDRAEVLFEVRAFNRGFGAMPYDPAIVASVDGGALFESALGGALAYDRVRGCGIALWPGGEPMDSASFDGGRLSLGRFAHGLDKRLGPRQLDVWSVSIQPLSGLDGVSGASPEIAIAMAGELRVQATQQRLGHKLIVLTEDGQSLVAAVDMYPERIAEIPIPSGVKALVIQDRAKREVFRFEHPLEPLSSWSAVVAEAHPPAELPRSLSEKALKRASFEPGLRHSAHLFLGMNALSRGEHSEAANEFESALLYNAEDHLAWWLKAVASRLSGDDEAERPELLNAHFLAPLEPALRAEGFLSQPPTAERDASLLLRPLEDDPEAFIEVACLLIDCGLWEESARWIDEALRHIDLPTLRYLLAYCHLKRTRMAFEAAKEVQIASKKSIRPPYPWRPIELEAIQTLIKAFPHDERLKEIQALLKAASL